MPRTKRCAIWSAPARRGKRISYGLDIGSVSFCSDTDSRQPAGMKAWTKAYLEWVKSQVHFEEPALEAALWDYFHEVEHAAARILRLEKALDEAIGKAPPQLRAVIEALQALRGVAQLTAATIVSEIGNFSRFEPRKLMGYSGLVASEQSSGTAKPDGVRSPKRGTHI